MNAGDNVTSIGFNADDADPIVHSNYSRIKTIKRVSYSKPQFLASVVRGTVA